MILKIKVKPGSKKEILEKLSDTEYKAELKEPPENNKANIALTNLLARHLKIPPKSIRIKNPKSRNKIVETTQQ